MYFLKKIEKNKLDDVIVKNSNPWQVPAFKV